MARIGCSHCTNGCFGSIPPYAMQSYWATFCLLLITAGMRPELDALHEIPILKAVAALLKTSLTSSRVSSLQGTQQCAAYLLTTHCFILNM